MERAFSAKPYPFLTSSFPRRREPIALQSRKNPQQEDLFMGKAVLSEKYSAYPEYKDSGVEWLDVIPRDWIVSKVKYLAPFQVGWTPPTKVDANFIGDNLWANISDLKGKYLKRTAKNISNEAATAASMEISPKGSLLYSFKLSVGAVSFACQDMYTNEAIASFLEGGRLPLSYMYYALPKFLIENASKNIYGARILNQELINNAFLLAPTFEEAEKIANFLDFETAKIDTLIEKQQQLIALLKEKRQAVISHAVTKGLNPNAPIRDSGVEWLGDVPEHWDVSSLKYHVDTVNGFGFSSSDVCEEGVPFIRAGNIKKKSVTQTDLYLPQRIVDRYKRVVLSEGDIVISMVGSDPRILESAVGQIGIVPKSMAGAVPNQNIVILREKTDSILKRFLFYVLCSESYRNHLNVFSHKLANQSIISSSLIVNAKFMLPSVGEQCEIIRFLDQRLEKFDEIMENNNGSLALLKERRTALISAAVTGKIDVRNWQAPEPSDQQNKEVAA
jgi:type I restriction enzyme S subunit